MLAVAIYVLSSGEDYPGGEELTLLKSLNVSFCINSLENSLTVIAEQQTRIVEQQAAILAEQKLNREQLEKFKFDVNERLWKIKSQQDMIKSRQEMIFTKQDQIQHTLHGETRAFQSPPLISSPPMTSPFASVAGSESFPKPSARTSSIADASEYSSIISEYDDSFFNLDWLVPMVQEEENSPLVKPPTGFPGSITDAGQSAGIIIGSQSTELSTGLPAGISEGLSTGISAGLSSGIFAGPSAGARAGIFAGPSAGARAGVSAGPSAGVSAGPSAGVSAGPSAGVSAGPSAGISAGPSAGVSAGTSAGISAGPSAGISAGPSAGISARPSTRISTGPSGISTGPSPRTGLSAQSVGPSTGISTSGKPTGIWKDPSEILDRSAEYERKDAGKLGRALAVHVYFGESVLRESTPCGKGKLPPLNKQKLQNLVMDIHHHPSFASMNMKDFQELVKSKIYPSIAHLCKELRNPPKQKK